MSEEVFYRPEEVAREKRTLPAAFYNLAKILVGRSLSGHVFVPIRSMQYLAILDGQEFIFVDGAGNRSIEISWCNFMPSTRNSLEDAVPFEAVYYSPQAHETMKRLQGDFSRALEACASKQAKPEGRAKVIRLKASA